jgi:hypothetical protein
MMDRLTDRSRLVLKQATEMAIKWGHDYIGTEHLLYGIADPGSTSVGAVALKNLNVGLQGLREDLSRLSVMGHNKQITPPLPFTPQAAASLRLAAVLAHDFGHPYIGVEHLLLGMLSDSDETVAQQALINRGAFPEMVRDEIYDLLGITPPPRATKQKAPMQVNGFQIREAIKQWTLKREMAVKVFNDAGFLFDGETKTHPIEAAEAVRHSDEAVARLETFQQAFNASSIVVFGDKRITLSQAVKMIAGIGRLENLWKTYASKGLTGNDSHRSYGETPGTIRKEGEIHAKRALDLATCVAQAAKYAKAQAALRALISSANGTQISVPNDLVDLFA